MTNGQWILTKIICYKNKSRGVSDIQVKWFRFELDNLVELL